MKPILIDFLRRWKWVYLLAGLLQLIPGLVAPPFFSLISTIILGSMLVSVDLARGTARTLQALPIKRKTLASAWWILGVIVPTTLFSVLLAVFCALRREFVLGGPISFSQATLATTVSFLWSGMSYYLLTHISMAGLVRTSESKTDNFTAYIWMASMFGGVFLFLKCPDHWGALNPMYWTLLIVGAVLTCLGWIRSEEMVISRATSAQNRMHGQNLRDSKKSQVSLSGPAGLLGLFRTAAMTSLKSSAIFIVTFIGLQVFLRKQTGDTIPMTIGRIVGDPITLYILSIMIVMAGLQWLSAVRYLRSLPIRTTHLVLIIALLFILPALFPISALGFTDFFFSTNWSPTVWAKRASLFGSVILVIPGLLLRFGLNWLSYFLTLVPIFVLAPVVSLLTPRISTPISLLICSVGWVAGAWLIYNALSARSQTYRHSMTWPLRPK
jgi:hypothetical protein